MFCCRPCFNQGMDDSKKGLGAFQVSLPRSVQDAMRPAAEWRAPEIEMAAPFVDIMRRLDRIDQRLDRLDQRVEDISRRLETSKP